jgi:hypothetical protein
VFPISEKLLLNGEPLSDARTPLAAFFSILLVIIARIPVLPPTFLHQD